MTGSFRFKARLIFYLLVAAAILIGFVSLTVRTSNLQFQINGLNKEIQAAERQVRSLEVEIKSATNITNLEERALALGLTYPEYDQIVYLDAEGPVIEDLALALKESIYE